MNIFVVQLAADRKHINCSQVLQEARLGKSLV